MARHVTARRPRDPLLPADVQQLVAIARALPARHRVRWFTRMAIARVPVAVRVHLAAAMGDPLTGRARIRRPRVLTDPHLRDPHPHAHPPRVLTDPHPDTCAHAGCGLCVSWTARAREVA